MKRAAVLPRHFSIPGISSPRRGRRRSTQENMSDRGNLARGRFLISRSQLLTQLSLSMRRCRRACSHFHYHLNIRKAEFEFPSGPVRELTQKGKLKLKGKWVGYMPSFFTSSL